MAERDLRVVARFLGTVSCDRAAHGPLGLTLTGCTADRPGERVELALAGTAPADLPGRLEDAVIESMGPGEYRIASAARTWTIAASSVHLHREVAGSFYRAIPPRPAPLARRALFAAMLGLARSRVGLALLRVWRR